MGLSCGQEIKAAVSGTNIFLLVHNTTADGDITTSVCYEHNLKNRLAAIYDDTGNTPASDGPCRCKTRFYKCLVTQARWYLSSKRR